MDKNDHFNIYMNRGTCRISSFITNQFQYFSNFRVFIVWNKMMIIDILNHSDERIGKND